MSDIETLRRHITILYDLARAAAASGDLDRLLDQAVNQVARAVEIDHVKVLQYRQSTADFLVAAGIGWREGVVRSATLSADLASAPGRSFLTAEPVVVHDFDQHRDLRNSDFLKLHGIQSLANAPIMTDGAAWGVLEVDSTVQRQFGADTTEFLMAAAAIIGSAIARGSENTSEAENRARAAAEARQRDIFLRELQHRVKNNFQLILSSVAMQKRRYPEPSVERALTHIAGRINAIALAHEQLTPRDAGHVVTLSAYLRVLCHTLKQQTDTIDLDIEADDVDLPIERAVPIGLIFNEAAINSMKHAFGPEGGQITVTLTTGHPYGSAKLTVSDNGKGMGSAPTTGSGRSLIASLARQIGGTVDYESSEAGTSLNLTFPVTG